jgi:hypothetical protein
MAKKKSRKKEDKKKKEKKKLLKLKLIKKKDSKKKGSKKKGSKKKDSKKKDIKKKDIKIKVPVKKESVKEETVKKIVSTQPEVPSIKNKDHSSNYNVKESIAKLRSLKSREEILAFTKGEKRVSVTKVIPAALNRMKS